MKLANPIEVAPGLYQVHAVAARVTVLAAERSALLIDAGGNGSAGFILSGLEALGIRPEQVSVIAVTHYHPDHVGGLERLVAGTNARVAAHRLDAGFIDGSKPRPDPYRNRIVAGVTRPVVTALYGRAASVDIRLEDGEALPFEEEVRVVHTPGHTPGSICLLIPGKGVLVVGDAMQFRFGRLGPPSEAVTADVRQAHESLAKLLQLDFDTICFSHYQPLRANGRRELELLVERLPAARA